MGYRDTGLRQLADLREHEQLAFAALTRMMLRLGGPAAPTMSQRLDELAAALGEELFWARIEDSDEVDQATEQLARAVERRGARELIYATLYEVAIPGSIVAPQTQLLDWLAELWSF